MNIRMGGLIAAVLLFSSCSGRYQKYQAVSGGTFDVDTTIIGYATSKDRFDKAAGAAFAVIESDGRLYDIYNTYEGVNNLKTVNDNAGIAPVPVDSAILDLLEFSVDAYEFTGGQVNVALGPVLRLWHDQREVGIADPDSAALPAMDDLTAAAQNTDINNLIIDRQAGTVFLAKKGMSLDVGALAKGFTAQRALEAAKQAGMKNLIINMGGNVVVSGKPMDGRDSWSVGVYNPEPDSGEVLLDTIYVNNTAVVSSGNYQRYYVVDGVPYNHIIDPSALMPARRYEHVTVLHPDSGVADALSTALFILPMEEGRKLAESQGAGAMWVGLNGEIGGATNSYAAVSDNYRRALVESK